MPAQAGIHCLIAPAPRGPRNCPASAMRGCTQPGCSPDPKYTDSAPGSVYSKGRARRIGLSPAEHSGTTGAVTTLLPGLLRGGVLASDAAYGIRLGYCPTRVLVEGANESTYRRPRSEEARYDLPPARRRPGPCRCSSRLRAFGSYTPPTRRRITAALRSERGHPGPHPPSRSLPEKGRPGKPLDRDRVTHKKGRARFLGLPWLALSTIRSCCLAPCLLKDLTACYSQASSSTASSAAMYPKVIAGPIVPPAPV